jgi:hypothetical protein
LAVVVWGQQQPVAQRSPSAQRVHPGVGRQAADRFGALLEG